MVLFMHGKYFIFILLLLAFNSLFASQLSQNSETTTITTTTVINLDDNIVSAIYKKYAQDSALIGTSLSVSSKDGIVTVTGAVTAQAQADEALSVAKNIPGVKDVRSNITVTTNPAKPSTPNVNY